MKVADNIEYNTILPDRLTWKNIKDGANRLWIKNIGPFPDGYYRLYIDQQGMVDLVHDVGARQWSLVNEGVFVNDNIMVILYENSFILDPWIPTYLIVTKNATAELIGMRQTKTGIG